MVMDIHTMYYRFDARQLLFCGCTKLCSNQLAYMYMHVYMYMNAPHLPVAEHRHV